MITFDRAKLIETIIYIAQRVEDPTVLRICKLAYMADKRHLATYGRYITGDFYVGMKNGPVPSNIYEMLVQARRGGLFADSIEVGDRNVKPLRDPDLEEFSDSDIRHLDNVIFELGAEPISTLVELSHDAAWKEATDNGMMFNDPDRPNMVHMDFDRIIDTLPDSEKVRRYIKHQHAYCDIE